MNRGTAIRRRIVWVAIGIIPVAWLALLLTPALVGGIGGDFEDFFNRITTEISTPLNISWQEDSLRTVLFFVFAYLFGVTAYFSTRGNKRPGEEHGSAKWGDVYSINRKYADKSDHLENKILTQHFRMGLDGHKHRRNLNTLIVGGSGSGKTRFYGKPNLLQANTSFLCLDPKGELLRDTAGYLANKGYVVKVLDLIQMDKSWGYNPFCYIRDDNDCQRLVTNLFKSTTPKGAQSQDPFWDHAAAMLLMALILYLVHEALPGEQNFAMVMEMLRAGEVREDDDDYKSPLDELFELLEMQDPHHIAVKYYKNYRSGSGKTLKSIQITLVARLEKFNLDSLANLTLDDELDLPSLGERKTVVFCVVPDNDPSFNFIVSILYTQLFQELFRIADYKYGGELPIPVHFLMDEFSNVSVPDDFEKILSVMRSRRVFVSIILQNLAQLKALFEKQWESIAGNCDTFLFLGGGNEPTTPEYITKLLDSETLDTCTHGKSRGRDRSYSDNYGQIARNLLTPGEVRALDNDYALLFIRGERPIVDKKYDLNHHPNIAYSADGGSEKYDHGKVENSNQLNIEVLAVENEEDLNPTTSKPISKGRKHHKKTT